MSDHYELRETNEVFNRCHNLWQAGEHELEPLDAVTALDEFVPAHSVTDARLKQNLVGKCVDFHKSQETGFNHEVWAQCNRETYRVERRNSINGHIGFQRLDPIMRTQQAFKQCLQQQLRERDHWRQATRVWGSHWVGGIEDGLSGQLGCSREVRRLLGDRRIPFLLRTSCGSRCVPGFFDGPRWR